MALSLIDRQEEKSKERERNELTAHPRNRKQQLVKVPCLERKGKTKGTRKKKNFIGTKANAIASGCLILDIQFPRIKSCP